jgi:hypothetical protein
MAQRTRVELVDDIDGKVLKDGDGETVSFSQDGTTYEIDLSRRNADKFRGLFQDYIAAGRRVGDGRNRRSGSSSTTASDYDPRAVRKWAASNKVEVPARGRIPREVLERFRAEGN